MLQCRNSLVYIDLYQIWLILWTSPQKQYGNIYIYSNIHIHIYIYIIYCICKYGNKYRKRIILVHHEVMYHLWNVCGPKCFSQQHLMLSASGSILVETHVNEMVGVDLSIPFVSVLSVCRQSSARMRGIYHSGNLSLWEFITLRIYHVWENW